MSSEAERHPPEGCPDAEHLGAYVEGVLSHAERDRIEAHLVECPECRMIAADATSFLHRPEASKQASRGVLVHRSAWRTRSIVVASILATAALVLVFVSTGRSRRGGDQFPELRELVAAVGANRPIEGRLTGGFAYGPIMAATRSGTGERPLSADIQIAAGRIRKEAERNTTPAALGAVGVVYLLEHNRDRAVELLQQATAQAPEHPGLLSNLAAAYLERGTAAQRTDDIARALEEAERAIRASTTAGETPLPEARFNRALALEKLSLDDQALEAWQEYRRSEPQSPWATEADQHIAALSRKRSGRAAAPPTRSQLADAIARRNREFLVLAARANAQTLRDEVESHLLPQWSDAIIRSSVSDADEALDEARVVAAVLETVAADHLPSESVRAIETCQRQERSHCLLSLATGHTRMRDGQRLADAFNFAAAAPLFDEARRALAAESSPARHWAAFQSALATYYARQLESAARELREIRQQIAGKQYPNLSGRIASVLGLIDADLSRYDEANDEYRTALTLFTRTREIENQVSIANLLADNLRVLGEFREAWALRHDALERVDGLSRVQRREGLFLATARLAETQSLPAVSLHFQDEALSIARRDDGPAARAQVLVRRAATYLSLGDVARSVADIDETRRWLKQVPDEHIVARLDAEALSVEAQLDAQSSHSESFVTRALAFSHRSGLANHTPLLHLVRGRLMLARRDEDWGESDFAEGIREFEEARAHAASEETRVSYFDRGSDLFAAMVALQVDKTDFARAFEYAERGRARAMHDSLLGQGESTATLAGLSRQLDPSTVVAYYAVLDDRTIIWTITSTGSACVVRPIGARELGARVKALRFALEFATERSRDELQTLFDVLVRPIKGTLERASRLVVVPDGDLNAVPFAALFDGTTRRHLVEDHVVSQAPSATTWLKTAAAQVGKKLRDEPPVVVISVPRPADPALPAIAGAAQEAADIAALYPRATVLANENAGKSAFRNALVRDGGIVHFAGHAIVNTEYPGLSRLLFAKQADVAERTLFARELVEGPRAECQLVVLAACATAGGVVSRREGPMSLARPLLMRGVPAVIASLWAVDDSAARQLFAEFYRRLRAGNDPFEALRRAQLHLLTAGDAGLSRATSWSAFVAIGYASAKETSHD